MKKSFFAIVLSLLLLFSGGQALASTATATSSLDVSSIIGISNTTWTFAPYVPGTNGTAAYARNFTDGISDGYNYGATSTSATVAGYATASGTIASNLYSTASYSDNSFSLETMSRSLSGYSGTFAYTGSGTYLAHVSIPYTVVLDLLASAGTDAVAYGNATISFVFATTSANRLGPTKTITQTQVVSIETQVVNGDTLYNNANNGTFAFDLLLFPGDSGTFAFNTLAETSASAVPLPAALWLLAPGLAGLVGIRRRIK